MLNKGKTWILNFSQDTFQWGQRKVRWPNQRKLAAGTWKRPLGKGETLTQTANFWVPAVSFWGVYLPLKDFGLHADPCLYMLVVKMCIFFFRKVMTKSLDIKTIPSWWFHFFLIFTPTWGNDAIWLDNIFQIGLKPPTSYPVFLQITSRRPMQPP